MNFPFLENGKTLCNISTPETGDKIESFCDTNEGNSDTAPEAFLRLIRYLRLTFLQDVVHWRERLPKDFLIWEHPLFFFRP